jgi:hypothetical protein
VPNLGGNSPIIIDTDGHGFDLTSAADGVLFDFFGDGHPFQMAWTAPDSTNGWLAIPGANGTVDSARELFGNADGYPNGFLKLATYDTNKDGQIDSRDDAWSMLRVWIDANHDGISQPEELRSLADVGTSSRLTSDTTRAATPISMATSSASRGG